MTQRTTLLLFVPAIILVGLVLLLEVLQYKPLYATLEPNKPSLDFIPVLPGDGIMGNRAAPQRIITFEDFGCTPCKNHMAVLRELVQKHPSEVHVVVKHFPVTTFPRPSQVAHEYVYCASAQGAFREAEQAMFDNQANLTEDTVRMEIGRLGIDMTAVDSCLAENSFQTYLAENQEVASSLGLAAVPASYLGQTAVNNTLTLAGWETLLGLPVTDL